MAVGGKIRLRSIEQKHALAVCFFLLVCVPSIACHQLLIEASTLYLNARVERILTREIATVVLRPGAMDRATLEEVTGLPPGAVISPAGDRIFRHYIERPEDYNSILESLTLLSGYQPFVDSSVNVYKRIYPDLSGLCLTDPSARPRDVGLLDGEAYHYVDIQLPPETPVISLGGLSRTHLVPMPRRYQKWIQERYVKYREGIYLPPAEYEMCQKIEAREAGRDISESYSIKFKLIGTGSYPGH